MGRTYVKFLHCILNFNMKLQYTIVMTIPGIAMTIRDSNYFHVYKAYVHLSSNVFLR